MDFDCNFFGKSQIFKTELFVACSLPVLPRPPATFWVSRKQWILCAISEKSYVLETEGNVDVAIFFETQLAIRVKVANYVSAQKPDFPTQV